MLDGKLVELDVRSWRPRAGMSAPLMESTPGIGHVLPTTSVATIGGSVDAFQTPGRPLD